VKAGSRDFIFLALDLYKFAFSEMMQKSFIFLMFLWFTPGTIPKDVNPCD